MDALILKLPFFEGWMRSREDKCRLRALVRGNRFDKRACMTDMRDLLAEHLGCVDFITEFAEAFGFGNDVGNYVEKI